ncbi:DUF305 domain-containing protein [Streptomyces sp. TRM68367]|uniref:DUF305 domain-containing protein n=1 Tax=Streptomyces sp. TRM68367 TaxID=2758415 RepID=UPI00165C0808|nr:DUF305 domain-containing protein [Streptomyces sp. TRM68367]MBC9723915.1 DUF305 domain-containing protein [Streptomyces sp. TRM68367]
MRDTTVTAPGVTDSDDTPTRKPSFGPWAVAAAALVALGLIVWFVAAPGDEGTSEVPAAASADAGFARDMAVHHQQAVEVSFVIHDRTDDEDVRRLAYDIAQTQANQRGMLLGWLDLWGLPKTSADGYMTWMKGDGHMRHETKEGSLMPGMATDTEIGRLGKTKGKDAEILYLQLLTDHHMGGVTMARACAEQCEVPQERRLAQGMVDAQQSEMTLMADMLKERGSAPH